ncbi:MAG: L,D-transpeptidase [Candidatus Pacebacteria bacterium]|nr:L,D-transpeptidase [Candidatus Paceibacterota bacterium]
MVSLKVSLLEQQLSVWDGKNILKLYPISTSQYGVGCENGSNKTPAGNFIISEKIGENAPTLTIFQGRRPIDICKNEQTEDDLILSRILWLDGVDVENRNTKKRYIYIHGTNQENLIGSPASHGCVRMKNRDVVELFDLVNIGTKICIT